MKLATRFWLYGALLPVVVSAAVLFVADRLFAHALARSLDQALLSQAAVESVSLFDGPDRRPHLHMATSPLVDSVRAFAPQGVLYGPDGYEVMRYPPQLRGAARPERELPGRPGVTPLLSTREHDGVRERSLAVTVASPRGEPYLLRLTASLAQFETAEETFRKLALAALLVVALSLALIQSWQARMIGRRLAELAAHAEALRAGDFSRTLAKEAERDELAALRDVTMQATRALKQAHDGKERLLADAAHELRTPLTLMRTQIDLALRRERSPDELKLALTDTREEVVRLAELATRLLDSAAIAQQAEPASDTDLVALTGDALAVARPQAEAQGLTLAYVGPSVLQARVRPMSLRRAVDNLLANALKHARSTITLELVDRREGLKLIVRDDGPGIPAAEHELVFEPFHRLSHSEPGAGLGLAIVREVARLHDGRAYVEADGEGGVLAMELREVR